MKTVAQIIESVRDVQNKTIGAVVIAPMVSKSQVFVKIHGYNHLFKIAEDFYNFDFVIGLFLVESMSHVSFIRSCTVHEQKEYLSMFPKKHIVVKRREDTHKMADANKAFSHFKW